MTRPAKGAQLNTTMDPALGEDLRMRHEGKYTKAKARKEVAWTVACLAFGAMMWTSGVWLEWQYKDITIATPLPHCVFTTYALCAAAYATSALLAIPKIVFDTDPTHYSLHLASLYISCLACCTYTLLSLNVPIIRLGVNTVLFLPIRWILYLTTIPAIWWILSHGSHYTLRRKIYIYFLMVVTLLSGGIATVPSLSWGHKMYWMTLACVPFPEVCFHLWSMLSDAIDALDVTFTSPRALYFLRIYSLFSFQAFPAIYFAAFDGVLSLAVSESLWALSDWALKMVMTSSLMEANFMTIEQRRDRSRRRLKERMRMSNILNLTSAIEAKDNFLATVSHELCTPLNGIIGLSYALQASQEVQVKNELSKTLTVITMSGKRLLQLINDVLNAAKTTADAPLNKRESVNVRALALDVAMLCSSIVRQGVDLRVQLQPVPRIIGDTGRIVQILHNLVGNACKFTKTGHVLIGVRYDSTLRAVALTVSDTGCGIPNEALHTVFDAFTQGVHRSSEGLGLGLHLVVEFVKAHHGLIEVESEVLKGSTFTVWLPVHPDKRLLRTALNADGRTQQDLVGGTVVIHRNSPDGVRSRLAMLSAAPNQPASSRRDAGAADAHGPAFIVSARPPIATAAELAGPCAPDPPLPPGRTKLRDVSPINSTRVSESSHSLIESTLPPPFTSSAHAAHATHAEHATLAARATVEAAAVPTAAQEASACYHGEVHGVPMVFVVGTVECDHLIDHLCAEGFMVEVLTSGSHALSRMRSSPLLPDAMLVFSEIEDIGGIEFVTQVRQCYPLHAFPIIFLSPTVGLDTLRKALNAGCMDVMQWPCIHQELMWRMRSQIAMHSNKRAVLHRGSGTLRPYKLQQLPYHMRHQLALATATDCVHEEGQPAIPHTYQHTAVLHLCIDNLYESSEAVQDQVSIVNEVHALLHQLLMHAPVCTIPGSPDGWTFAADPDVVLQRTGINQFAAEAVLQVEQLAQKHGRVLNPRMGVAFGSLCLSVTSVVSEASFMVVGQPITVATAVAQATPTGTIAFVQSPLLKALQPADATVPMNLSRPGGKYMTVDVQIMPPQNAYSHCFLDDAMLTRLKPLHSVFSCLQTARGAVHGRRHGVQRQLLASAAAAADTPKPAAGRSLYSTHTRHVSHNSTKLGSNDASSASSSAAASWAPAARGGGRQPLSQVAMDALNRAHARLDEADVPKHALANAPMLSAISQRSGIRLPHTLAQLDIGVSVIAFLEASDMTLLDMPGTDGVRLLTSCKRAFTDAMLGALNQVLTKPCVRE
eukprot:jgi/Ulvmu1/992/UM103_0019.1